MPDWKLGRKYNYVTTAAEIRPGKVDTLFLITHFFNLDVGGQSLFIIGTCGVRYNYTHALRTCIVLAPQQCISRDQN